MFELENTNQLPLGLRVITCLVCACAQEGSLGTSRGKSLVFVLTVLIQKYMCLNPSYCSQLNRCEQWKFTGIGGGGFGVLAVLAELPAS